MSARVGLVGIGLREYWAQFDGLEQRLKGYVAQVAEKLRTMAVEVIDLGLIDTAGKSMAAGHQLRREDIDLLVIYATTYALSSNVLPMVQRARVPVLVLNLQPGAAIDYVRFNALGDRKDDRRVARIVHRLRDTRDRECAAACRYSPASGHRRFRG